MPRKSAPARKTAPRRKPAGAQPPASPRRAARRGWTLKRAGDHAVERSACGHRLRLFSSEDATPAAFLHLVKIHQAEAHYHMKTTEYYYVVEGSGTMTLDGEPVALGQGDCLEVRPGTIHAARGDLLVLVIGVPDISETDTFFPGGPLQCKE